MLLLVGKLEPLFTTIHIAIVMIIAMLPTFHIGTDFIIMGGVTQTISFSPEEMYKDIEVIVVQDILGEGNEVMVLDLVAHNNGNVINVGSHQLQTAITIIEDDSESYPYKPILPLEYIILLYHFLADVSVSLTFNNNQIYVIEGEIFQFCVSVVAGFSSFLQNGFVDITVYTVTGTASGKQYAIIYVTAKLRLLSYKCRK